MTLQLLFFAVALPRFNSVLFRRGNVTMVLFAMGGSSLRFNSVLFRRGNVTPASGKLCYIWFSRFSFADPATQLYLTITQETTLA